VTIRPFNENLQRNFRDQTGSPGAPKVIDDEVPAQAVILMGANFDGSNALYVRTGTFESPFLSNQTQVSIRAAGANTGVTVYTVTTGKKFHVMGYHVCNGGIAGNVNITGPTTPISAYLGVGGVLSASSVTPIISVASGTAIVFGHGFGAAAGWLQMWGYEQ